MLRRRLLIHRLRTLIAALGLCFLLVAGNSCLPGPSTGKGGRTITVYGFSVMKESLEKTIFPGFAARWKQEHGKM
jgi:hypothetical protein